MRCSFSLLTAAMVLACVTALAQGPTYQMGRRPSAEEIKARDTAVSPDGKELPPGSGTAKEGARSLRRSARRVMGQTRRAARCIAGSSRSATPSP